MRSLLLLPLAALLSACAPASQEETSPLEQAEAFIRDGRPADAIPLLEAASDTSESALMNLAMLLAATDRPRALDALERGAAKGWDGAAFLAASMRLVGPDSSEGLRRLRALAADGHVQAMHELGSLYVQGRRGVTAHVDSGLVWMAQADRIAPANARRTMAHARQTWPDTLRARYDATLASLAPAP